jgi:protein SCO1/2
VVVFFYTRCDNPQKCSLTITKLARLQNSLLDRGLAEQIRTAAITYDPAFDTPERLRGYAKNRGVLLNANHRMLRAIDGISALRAHFKLGVNFVASLVNRHRIEVYLLDAAGGIAGSFQRVHWDEQKIVDRAVALLNERRRASRTRRSVRPFT